MKRARVRQTPSPQRSPSPTLPLHLYTSLPSSSAHHPLAAIQAREATLLDPRDWNALLEPVAWTGRVNDDSQQQPQRREVVTDRYDILHLVPSIPPPPTRDDDGSGALSDVRGFGFGFGFEDLPSDHEELFFLNSSADRADLERRKKRRKLQDERDQRVRERLLQQGDGDAGDGEAESHNDDEPPTEINQLMSRLHATLSRSANPALLELRILANHGSDPRFASFLKREGRWYQWWVELREGRVGVAPKEEKEEKATATATGGLGGLTAYGSDSDDDAGASPNEGDEDGQDAQDRSSKAEAKDDAGPGASSSSTASVPGSASTVPSTTTTSSITSAPPPPPTDPSAPRNGNSVERTTTTVAQEVKAEEEEEDREGGDYIAKRQEEEEEKKEARAVKAREWARRRREARLGLGLGLGLDGREGDKS